VLLEELGFSARDLPGCRSLPARASLLGAKRDNAAAAGADGVLLWAYGDGSTRCDYYISRDDPAMELLAS
jgi:hypothetical protein